MLVKQRRMFSRALGVVCPSGDVNPAGRGAQSLLTLKLRPDVLCVEQVATRRHLRNRYRVELELNQRAGHHTARSGGT